MPNPFTNRRMIQDSQQFFDRQRELEQIFSRLEPRQPQSVSIVGPNRIGRSSLLEQVRQTYAQHLPKPQRYHLVYLDAQGVRPSADWVRARVVKAFTGQPSAAASATPSREALYLQVRDGYNEEELQNLCFELVVDYESLPAKGKAAKARELVLYLERNNRLSELVTAVQRDRPATLSNSINGLSADAFEEALDARHAEGHCPVLLLDEFEKLLEHPTVFDDAFFDWLRSLLNRGLLTMVTVSAQPLPEIQQQCRFVSAFFNVFTQVDLGELTRAETLTLLTQPSDRPFAEAHVQFVLGLVGSHHPLKLTMAADRLYQNYGAEGVDEAQAAQIRAAYQKDLRMIGVGR